MCNHRKLLQVKVIGNYCNMGGVKGHQTLTSCCDLNIGRRETCDLPSCSGRLLPILEKSYNLKHVGFHGNDRDLPRKPEVEFEPPVRLP